MASLGTARKGQGGPDGVVIKTIGGYYVLGRTAPPDQSGPGDGVKTALLWPGWAPPEKTRAGQTEWLSKR